jgi:hypothetical protein
MNLEILQNFEVFVSWELRSLHETFFQGTFEVVSSSEM